MNEEPWVQTLARVKKLINEEQKKRWLMFKDLIDSKFKKKVEQPKDYYDK